MTLYALQNLSSLCEMNCNKIFQYLIGTAFLLVIINIVSFGSGIFLIFQSLQRGFNPEQPTVISLADLSVAYLSMTASREVVAIVGSTAPEAVTTNRTETKEFQYVLEGDNLISVHYAKDFHVTTSAEAMFAIENDAPSKAVSVGATCWDIDGSVVFTYVRSVQGNASFIEQLGFPQNAATCRFSADRAAAFGRFAFNARLKYNVPLFRFRPEDVVKTVDFQMANDASLQAHYNQYVIIVPRSKRASVSFLGRYTYPKQFIFDLLEIFIVIISFLMAKTMTDAESFKNRITSGWKRAGHKGYSKLALEPKSSACCADFKFSFSALASFIIGLVFLVVISSEFTRYISVFPGQELVINVEQEFSATKGILERTQGAIAAVSQNAPDYDYRIALQSNDTLSFKQFDYIYEQFDLGQLQKSSSVQVKTVSAIPETKVYLALVTKNLVAGIVLVVEMGPEVNFVVPAFGDYTLIVFTSDHLKSHLELNLELVVNNAKVLPGDDVTYCDLSVENCVFEPPNKYVTIYGSKTQYGYSYIIFSLKRFTALATAKLSGLVIVSIAFIVLSVYLMYRRNQK